MTKAKEKKVTNEARLRSLKGERLAVFLTNNNFCPGSPLACEGLRCGECILRWLKEVAE